MYHSSACIKAMCIIMKKDQKFTSWNENVDSILKYQVYSAKERQNSTFRLSSKIYKPDFIFTKLQ